MRPGPARPIAPPAGRSRGVRRKTRVTRAAGMSEYRADPGSDAVMPIAFGERFATSETFRDLFREGMALVEETAAYLDGPGRTEGRNLSRSGTLAYTTESMRLTTRLMQIASWLLLQRAVNDGELSQDQASTEKNKVRLDGPAGPTDGAQWDELPEALRSLIERSNRLQLRVRHLDAVIYGPKEPTPVAVNPIARNLGRLADAFGARRADG
jgi:regulator of CtrA degradation